MMKLLSITIFLSCGISCYCQQENTTTTTVDTMPLVRLKTEPKFYLNVHAGYAYGLGSTFKFYPDDISSVKVEQIGNNPTAKNVQYKEESKGLGEGFRFGVGLSYIINDFLNVGIDIDYFKSTIHKVRDSSFHKTQLRSGSVDDLSYNEKYKISYDATLVTFSPNITFKAISRPKFFIYNKVGAILIFRPNSIQRESQAGNYKMGWQGFFRDSSAISEKRYEWGIKNPAFGFMGGVGAQSKITERIRAFAEMQFTHVVFKVRNRILTNFMVDGTETVNTLPVSAKEIVFKKSFNASEVSTDPNQPAVAIYQRFPITYVGLQLGIAYRF
ncbi:MAG: hypothetical protein ABIU30_08800 [Ferruginibacter sp.]